MKGIEIQATEKEYIITLDKKLIDEEALTKVLESIYLEYLAQIVDFDESIVELGEEIQKSWWEQNKDRILKKVENYETSYSGQQ
jgi:6-pyruvoyl-tetrahydropterin synthase